MSGGNSSANKSVALATAQCGKRKRSLYHHYIAEVRPKYALENEELTVNKFSAEHGRSVCEGTARIFKCPYLLKVKAGNIVVLKQQQLLPNSLEITWQ